VTNPQRARGRQPRSFNPLVPTWNRTRQKAMRPGRMMAPIIPPQEDWLAGMPANLGGLLNAYDPAYPNGLILGDCTIACILHILQMFLFRITGRFWTDAELRPVALKYYSLWCGYVQGNPATDQGGNIQTVLTNWMTQGIELPDGTLHKIDGFIEIDTTNEVELREAIAVCGAIDFGAEIPDAYDQISEGDSWLSNMGQPTGGHSFGSQKFLASEIVMMTWGFQVPMPPTAVTEYVDEGYSIISKDWIMKTGKSPFDMSFDDIDAMMLPLRQQSAAMV
jgi:hypothetical protein